jgi:hypothetical protein
MCQDSQPSESYSEPSGYEIGFTTTFIKRTIIISIVFNTFKRETRLNDVLEFSLCLKKKIVRLNYENLRILYKEIKK